MRQPTSGESITAVNQSEVFQISKIVHTIRDAYAILHQEVYMAITFVLDLYLKPRNNRSRSNDSRYKGISGISDFVLFKLESINLLRIPLKAEPIYNIHTPVFFNIKSFS